MVPLVRVGCKADNLLCKKVIVAKSIVHTGWPNFQGWTDRQNLLRLAQKGFFFNYDEMKNSAIGTETLTYNQHNKSVQIEVIIL
jgi:hypothetical protein